MSFWQDKLKATRLDTLFGAVTISLMLAAVDAIRVIISFDYLFITLLDKLLLVFTSMLLYMGISILVWFAAVASVKLFFAVLRKKLSGQLLSYICICLTTTVTALPLVLFFYNSKIRFVFPIKSHIADLAYISLICLSLGILSSLLFCRKTKPHKMILKVIVPAFFLPLIAAVVIHITTKDIEGDKTDNRPNVVLMVVDTLRADHLGCYGYGRPTSPNIDKLAKDGVLFENAFAQAPWTLPSIMSIMTSLYPSVHGFDLMANFGKVLDDERKTLAEYLKEDGYATGAFVGVGGNVSSRFHGQGFDFYDDEVSYSSRYNHLVLLNIIDRGLGFYSSRLADTTVTQINYWLSNNKNKPFFLFAHCFDPHDPYGSPEPFTTIHTHNYKGTMTPGVYGEDVDPSVRQLSQEDMEYVVSLYDGEISFVDAQVGKLIRQLEELDLMDNTLIVFTADHGEEFWEHGSIGHGKVNYDESIKIPLIIKHPSLRRNRIENQAQLIDILPTILDYLDISVNDEAQGVSLYPLIRGQADRELPAFSETKLSVRVISIRTRNYKFIKSMGSGTEELYDLQKDPGELNNIVQDKVETANQMRQELLEWKKNCVEKKASLPKANEDNTVPLDDKIMEELRSLGYLD